MFYFLIAGLGDLAEPITQIVDRICDTVTLFTLHLALMGDSSHTLLAAPISLQQIVRGLPFIYRQL
ncbi:hypothetical protein B4U45_02160 [Mycobacterium persicum]|uniref:Uncharacterized protein n=1 Tax=Mycobacterium persicum TaxID=1487726 RepID=A0A8E2LKW1_9MYCO|nr:hypothetical protein B1T49_06020 [Mycobacterium persicum]ORB93569.1 hypothetical protein B1T44_02185 [Mycobacterium persicum]ORC05646.1 hypothetical protein B4U45_02160 [Mycobacterium persicum]